MCSVRQPAARKGGRPRPDPSANDARGRLCSSPCRRLDARVAVPRLMPSSRVIEHAPPAPGTAPPATASHPSRGGGACPRRTPWFSSTTRRRRRRRPRGHVAAPSRFPRASARLHFPHTRGSHGCGVGEQVVRQPPSVGKHEAPRALLVVQVDPCTSGGGGVRPFFSNFGELRCNFLFVGGGGAINPSNKGIVRVQPDENRYLCSKVRLKRVLSD